MSAELSKLASSLPSPAPSVRPASRSAWSLRSFARTLLLQAGFDMATDITEAVIGGGLYATALVLALLVLFRPRKRRNS